MALFYRRVCLAALLLLLAALVPTAQPARAASLVVSKTADTNDGTCDGDCSLREAIAAANAGGAGDVITFNIPTSDPNYNPAGFWRLQLGGNLPDLSGGGDQILGPSNPSSPTAWAHPRIVLDGTGLLSANGLKITSAGNTVSRLTIVNFRETTLTGPNGAGIVITGASATGNAIEGSYIGVDPSVGSGTSGNQTGGVLITDGASSNTIGGDTAAKRNVIAGNGWKTSGFRGQVYISSSTATVSSANSIRGNYVGTNADGTAQVTGGNASYGVWLSDKANGTVVAGNLFAGFSATNRELAAVLLLASSATDAPDGTVVRGNIFGLPASGQGPSGNSLYNTNAVKVQSGKNTLIGGATAADRNIISGAGYAPTGSSYQTNVLAGVYVTGTDATGTTIQGNYIGLDIDGDSLGRAVDGALGNLNYGVNLTNNSSGSVVRNNVIANSRADGVHVSSSGNTLEGNFIGTNAAGTASDVSYNNDSAGVRVDRGDGNIIRTSTIAAGASTLTAVLLKPFSNTSVTNTTVQGNRIGLNSSGAALVSTADESTGILLDKADGSATGVTSGATISGNTIGALEYGVKIEDASAAGHVVRANTIGPTSGPSGVPSVTAGFGIWLLNATGITIGGASAADGNTVFGAGSHGIYVDGASSSGNTVQNNTLRDNAGDGIHVRGATGIAIDRTATRGNGGAGITLSSGGNAAIAAPTIGATPFSATPSPQLTVGVPAGACGASGCKLQVFTGTSSDPFEGPRFLAEADVAAGATSATVAVPACDRYLSATLRDVASGNTSQFSAQVDTTTGCGAASLTLSNGVRVPPGFTGAGAVPPGSQVVYRYTVTNGGGLPTSVSMSRSAGGFPFTGPTPSSFTLGGGLSQTVLITVSVPLNATGGAVDSFTVTATGGATPQTVTTTTTVAQSFGVDLAAEAPVDRTFASGGVTLSYTHVITNTGNGPDTINVTTSATPSLGGITVTPLTSCTNVAAGATCRVRVDVPIPSVGTQAAYDITVTATSAGDGTKTDSALNRAIGAAAAPGLTPQNQTKDALPGQTVTFTRTVANVGTQSGSFTPSVSLTPPEAGWSATLDSTTSFVLAPAETHLITNTVVVPPLSGTTPLSGTLVNAQVTVTSSDSIAATGLDTVRVRLLPRFELDAADTPQTAAPGATVVFTHTLRNTANGPDSFTLVLTPTAGLENVTRTPAGTITLARGATVDVVVRARVKDFQDPGPQSIQISAQTTSSPKPAAATQTDVVNVPAVAGISLSPAQTRAVAAVPASVTFTHVLTNVGNISGDFAVVPTLIGAPAGWTVDPLVESPAGCLTGLAKAGTCQFSVTVNVPASPLPLSRDYGLQIVVTTTGASASLTDTISVGPIAGLAFAPDRAGSTAPDTPIAYTHTLTNTGNVTATFTLAVQSAPPGWPAPQISPAVLPSVPPGITRTVTVRVTPPANAPAGGPLDVVVRATSSVAPAPTAAVTDSTTILAAPAGRLTPAEQTRSVFPTPSQPDTATFALQLANSGNTVISYTLGLVPLSGGPSWTALITPTTTSSLAADVSVTTPVTVTVRAPAGASGSRAFRVEARSGVTNALLASAVLTATATTPITDLLTPLLNSASAPPGSLVVYTHTLKNVRAISDTFQLTTVAPFGWETVAAPTSVFLPPGGSTSVSVSIRVPTNVVSGTLDITTLRATSVSDPSITAAAQERTTVTRIATAALSPRFVQLVTPGQVLDFRHTLVNTGNALDSFSIQAVSSLGWPVTVLNGSPTLAPAGFDNFIVVRVTVPAGAPLGSVNRVTVTATSQGAGGVVSTLEHVLALPPPVDPVVEYSTYLTLVSR